MKPAKEAAIRVAAERLALARVRFEMVSASPRGSDMQQRIEREQQYQLAFAEFAEADTEMARVTRAEFQPELPKEGT